MTSMLALCQLPVLFTWFITLRYVVSLQDKFPELVYQGFFWFKDLTVYDPYCILPVSSALISYFNITLSNNLNT
jgi:YidC/Oxa1 family membrane protein insertase